MRARIQMIAVLILLAVTESIAQTPSTNDLAPVVNGHASRRAGENLPWARAVHFIGGGWQPVIEVNGNNALQLYDPRDNSRVVLAQAVVGAAGPTGAPDGDNTTNNAFDQSRPTGSAFGWLGNTLHSGIETYLDVSVAGVVGQGLSAAMVESREDAGSLFSNVPGNAIEKRGNGQNNAYQRGRYIGRHNLRGSYWFPARQDLDTLLSKIDSHLVDEIIAINGPYSALYGPGLAFYDLHLLKAPRSDHGFATFGSTGLDYQTNGDKWYGRQSFWGGDQDWGFRVGYGHRIGNDYETGAGALMPSSENSRMLDIALGADLTSDSHLDFAYLRLDQTDVEYPGQFFDINFLVTDAYEVTYVLEDQRHFDAMTVETWYNRTRFDGDNLRRGKRRQIPDLESFPTDFGVPSGRPLLGFTDVDAMSTGYRLAFSWDDCHGRSLTAGSDLRYLKQRLDERNFIGGALARSIIPRSHSSNPGLFAETVIPISDRLTVKSGTRVDWVSMNAESEPITEFLLGGNPFDQHFLLWSGFVTANYQMDSNWVLTSGFGHSMRPPTMTEMYAFSPFVAVLPQFAFTKIFGNPSLDPESMWQIDLGLTGDYGRFRGGISGFYSWIDDYITLDFLTPPSGIAFGYINTDLATIAGGEAFGEYDLSRCVTGFALATFVEGRDRTRQSGSSPARNAFPFFPPAVRPEREPLPAISPLEGRVGLTLHDPNPTPNWSVELSARIVDTQDRVAASLREETTPGFTTYDLRGYFRASDNLMLTAGVENFTDKQYQEHLDTHIFAEVFQPGVNFYFGAEASY